MVRIVAGTMDGLRLVNQVAERAIQKIADFRKSPIVTGGVGHAVGRCLRFTIIRANLNVLLD